MSKKTAPKKARTPKYIRWYVRHAAALMKMKPSLRELASSLVSLTRAERREFARYADARVPNFGTDLVRWVES